MANRVNKTNRAEKILLALMATVGATLATRECAKPSEKEIIPPINIEPTFEEPTEPTIITVYIYENEEGEMTPPESKNPGRNMIDELKNLLKLNEDQEKKLLELVRNDKFEEAKKYLETLLLEHNIKIEYWVIKKVHEIQPQFSRPLQIFKDDVPPSSIPRLRDYNQHPNPERLRQIEARRKQAETGEKVGEWLKIIEDARRNKEKNGGIEP
jgi:hypothetical protein